MILGNLNNPYYKEEKKILKKLVMLGIPRKHRSKVNIIIYFIIRFGFI